MVRSRCGISGEEPRKGLYVLRENLTAKSTGKKLKELVKEYEIKYDPETLIPADDSLVDDIFKAGWDLLLEVGVLCVDTVRIIKFEEYEVKETLKTAPAEMVFGYGKDAVKMVHRKLEDPPPLMIMGGCTAEPVSEEWAVRIYQSHAKEPFVDSLSGNSQNLGGASRESRFSCGNSS